MLWYLKYVQGISLQCLTVQSVAKNLGYKINQPLKWTLMLVDCCNLDLGVTCGGLFDLQVTGINWSGLNLDGQLIGINALTSLGELDLSKNKISGTLPLFPTSLVYLDLSQNLLTGSIHTLPSSLAKLKLEGNALSGNLNAFPNALVYLSLGMPGITGNLLSGNLTLFKPKGLYINSNNITDIQLADYSVMGTNCDISNNPLGESPNLKKLANCLQSGINMQTNSINKLISTLDSSVAIQSSLVLIETSTASLASVKSKAQVSNTSTTYETASTRNLAQTMTLKSSAELTILDNSTPTTESSPEFVSYYMKSVLQQNSDVELLKEHLSDLQTAQSEQFHIQSDSSITSDSLVYKLFFTEAKPEESDAWYNRSYNTEHELPLKNISSSYEATPKTVLSADNVMYLLNVNSQHVSMIGKNNGIFNDGGVDSVDQPNEENKKSESVPNLLLYIAVGGFLGCCLLILIAAKIFRNPIIHSRFIRKSSFGTLNTFNDPKTPESPSKINF